MNVQGQYFLIHKHWKSKKKSRRRKFYAADELVAAQVLAEKYAAANHTDYLLVQVIQEFSAPPRPAEAEAPAQPARAKRAKPEMPSHARPKARR